MASVMPIMEVWTSFGDDDGFSVNVANKGIGPALIQSVDIFRQDEAYQNWFEVFSNSMDERARYFQQSMVTGNVMAPNQEQTVIRYTQADDARDAWQVSRDITMKICYCSVFGECWTFELENLIEGFPKSQAAEQCEVKKDNAF